VSHWLGALITSAEIIGTTGLTPVRAVNLGYRDPATVDVPAFAADPDTLVVPRAGEVLFRLR
jgi:hypothetical protein